MADSSSTSNLNLWRLLSDIEGKLFSIVELGSKDPFTHLGRYLSPCNIGTESPRYTLLHPSPSVGTFCINTLNVRVAHYESIFDFAKIRIFFNILKKVFAEVSTRSIKREWDYFCGIMQALSTDGMERIAGECDFFGKVMYVCRSHRVTANVTML